MRSARVALLFLAACTAEGQRQEGALVVRVSTHAGVSTISPSARSTIASNLLDLVYEKGAAHIEELQVQGQEVSFLRRSDTSASSADLARALRGEGLLWTHPTVEGFRAEYDSVETARKVSLDDYLFELGPYQADDLQGALVLRKRAKGGLGPDRIEFRSVPESEEWKRFLGQEFDIVSYVSTENMRHLRELPSVRLVPFSHHNTIALLFSFVPGHVLDARLRRAIALGLHREALAMVATGKREVAIAMRENRDEARALVRDWPWARSLEVIFYRDQSQFEEVAVALERQLVEIGIPCELRPVALPELTWRMREGTFDALLFFGSYEGPFRERLRSDDLGNSGKYANPDYDSALLAGDEGEVLRVLHRDVPLTPLFAAEEGVAAARSLCGIRPERASDFRWLLRVHRCAPGEEE